MKIAPRIVTLFLPLAVIPLLFFAYVASLSARDGLTSVARNFLRFKTDETLRFAESQYRLLEKNGLTDEPAFVDAAEKAVADYARGLVRSPGELILAIDDTGGLRFATSAVEADAETRSVLAQLAEGGRTGWQEPILFGEKRVAFIEHFSPFSWTLLITERHDSFFGPVRRIIRQSVFITVGTIAAVVLLILFFSNLLTRPVKRVVSAMRTVIATGDLSLSVEAPYDDEIGELCDTFTAMTGALDGAYTEVRNYALQAAVSRNREEKIRHIFQKYVPNQVIERFFASPESMLVGEERTLTVLFSDIRGFTTFSEGLCSQEVVESLNAYFGYMVDAIMRNSGVVDKYMGDAIMAFFGAPAEDENSAFHSVSAGLDMLEGLKQFNEWQERRGRQPIRIGIGINYGGVTIGNIGSEHKMDYTIIGSMVNTASRLEGLTKFYGEPLIVSESVLPFIEESYPCRMLDLVRVKGSAQDTAIHAVRSSLSDRETEAWDLHRRAIAHYYRRDFREALHLFENVRKLLPGDRVSDLFGARCRTHIETPPPADWTGVTAYTEK